MSNNKQMFKIGDKVRVTKAYCNASRVSTDDENKILHYKGVYSIENWQDTIFTISGKYKPTKFDHNKEIYGAYPLSFDGKLVGYVYNDVLELVK